MQLQYGAVLHNKLRAINSFKKGISFALVLEVWRVRCWCGLASSVGQDGVDEQDRPVDDGQGRLGQVVSYVLWPPAVLVPETGIVLRKFKLFQRFWNLFLAIVPNPQWINNNVVNKL